VADLCNLGGLGATRGYRLQANPELVRERITRPRGWQTLFSPNNEQRAGLVQGHDVGGEPMSDVPTGPIKEGIPCSY
jgi:hypothetical protein